MNKVKCSQNLELEFRSYSGEGNNKDHPDWGQAGMPLLRKAPVAYEDGTGTLAIRCGSDKCHPRAVSNKFCDENGKGLENDAGLSDFVWAWGQFLDHEIDLSPEQEKSDNLKVPEGVLLPPKVAPPAEIPFKRSKGESDSDGVRQQINVLSSYIDGANVYGADCTRAAALRRFDGTGRLKVTESEKGDLLPYNLAGLPNAEEPRDLPPSYFFLAGDIRCNEHGVLTSLHTLFVREHNRLCLVILRAHPEFVGKDECVYQLARKIVGAYMQQITLNAFLPTILGADALDPYQGYNPDINATIANEFSAAFYRLGHSMLSEDIHLGRSGDTIPLRESFFNPNRIRFFTGIEPFLEGLVYGRMRRIDTRVVDSVRNFLFNPPNVASPNAPSNKFLDLAALNIQRSRDHGIAGYNACREAYGLQQYTNFEDITSDNDLVRDLKDTYGEIDNIDPWLGGLAEDHVKGAQVGPLIRAALTDQFLRLRDGDRFWWQNDPEFEKDYLSDFVRDIESITLGRIIVRNTNIPEFPDDVFHTI